MSTVFTMIMKGEIPSRMIWQDEKAVAFFTIEPFQYGHTLVVPREEIDHWVDMPADLSAHVFGVAHKVSAGLQKAFNPTRVGMMIAGFDVPHTHIHVWPALDQSEFTFEQANRNPDADKMDEAAAQLRAALTELGHGEFVAS
ncbi:MAG: HIT family protein [Rothia sp. (in: high G+C Gram-positive bacteria)]|nr:HIT family protein [Rothia sp. (in: high G+C Gram-positive bacteria)]